MRILNTFNTRYHKEKFIQLTNELGDKKVISFRRHMFYLTPAFGYWILSLIGFLLVNGSIYFQFQAYPNIYYTYITIAGLIYAIWSITFFISYIRILFSQSPIANSLGQANNLNNKYIFFIKLSIILFFVRIFMLSFGIFLEFYLPHPERLFGFSTLIFHIVSCIIYLLGVYLTVHRVIFYSMSFCTVTPQSLEIVEQSGFLKRNSTTIQLNRLTLITVTENGFIQSFFRFGDIYFHTDSMIDGEDNNMHISFAPKTIFLKEILQNTINTV